MSLRLGRSAIACAALLLAACARSNLAHPSSSRLSSPVLDGDFADWQGIAPAVRAAPSTRATPDADPVAIAERADGQYVYLDVQLSRPANLLGFDGSLSIEMDGDDDPSTGATIDGLAGTDFAIDLSPPGKTGAPTQGATVRAFAANGTVTTSDTYPLDFVLQPTYEASRFELRIGRGRTLAARTTLDRPSYTAQLVVRDSTGAVVKRVGPYTAHVGAAAAAAPIVALVDPLARAAGTEFRALVWNVANEGILERPDHFRRILSAVAPDLLILNEVAGAAGRERVAQFLATVDDASGRPWHFTYGLGGGYQRTVIASRAPVDEFPEFRLIAFPDSLVRRWFPLVPPQTQEKERKSIADSVATGGAIVTLGGKRVAVFGVDLQSAGNRHGQWQEMRRQAEATLIRDHAVTAIRAHGPVEGIIKAGDHNLVGTRTPLELLDGIGAPFYGKPLDNAYLLQLDRETATTWTGRGGQFPPGRLDWFSYSGTTLAVLGGFVFDAGDLSPAWRARHHLEADDSEKSSDHRPLVVDLKWR